MKKGDTLKHLDGIIIKGERISSYYGYINKGELIKIISEQDFVVIESWTEGHSAYVLATSTQ